MNVSCDFRFRFRGIILHVFFFEEISFLVINDLFVYNKFPEQYLGIHPRYC